MPVRYRQGAQPTNCLAYPATYVRVSYRHRLVCDGFRTIDDMEVRIGLANSVTKGSVLGQDATPNPLTTTSL